MKKVKYDEVKGRYTEAVLNMKKTVLFFPALIYDPEKKLHIYYLTYDEHPDEPYNIVVEPNDKVYGSIISPFPLNMRAGNIRIFDYDFLLKCRYVKPEDIGNWIEEQWCVESFREEDILDDIARILYRFRYRGVDDEETKKFFIENSFYFAVLLKEKMNSGFIMVSIPENHVVWVNYTGKAYDANGRYEPKNILIPTHAEVNGVNVSIDYLGKDSIKFSDDDCKALTEAYKNWFPNA